MRTVLNEYNIRLGKSCYLPLATGLLRAYAEGSGPLKDKYEFAEFLYHIDTPARILAHYDQPTHVAAFSVAVWNEQLCLTIAREVKKRWPDCLIVFGGLQVPDIPDNYMALYPFIDVCIRRQGERSFEHVLRRYAEGADFSDLPQVSYRTADGVVVNRADWGFEKEIDYLPSPVLSGLFDGLMPFHGNEVEFCYVLETNRGCPFFCSFCEYGLSQHKLSYYSMDRVKAEIDWVGHNKIPYLLGADANFGMLPRDREIAEYLVKTKERYGFPQFFRVNFGKNRTEMVYETAKILSNAGMTKGMTLARQSNDDEVLKNIKRSNIKLSTYSALQGRFNDDGVLTYSEFIMGLPGETYETWKKGLDETAIAGMKNQIIIYPCMALPNTDIGRPDYQWQFGIKTRRILAGEIHGQVRSSEMVPEYQDIVVETNSLPLEEWRKTCIYSWIFMALHGLKLGYFAMIYLMDRGLPPSYMVERIMEKPGRFWTKEIAHYNKILDGVLQRGEPIASILPEYGNVYWAPEEATFLRATENIDAFYAELLTIVMYHYEVAFYQAMRMPTMKSPKKNDAVVSYNWDEYFEYRFNTHPVPLRSSLEKYTRLPKKYQDKEEFARETVIYGRKSGDFLVPIEITNAGTILN